MSTNVRPGDKAIVVQSRSVENVGKIVLVLHEAPPRGSEFALPDGDLMHVTSAGVVWVVETCGGPIHAKYTHGGYARCGQFHAFRDSALRPIRDTDGEDEMITIAGPAPEHGRIREWEGQP
jgi:hypothetical protein